MKSDNEIANIVYNSKPKGYDDCFNKICEKLKEDGRCSNYEDIEHDVCSDMYHIWSIIEGRYL